MRLERRVTRRLCYRKTCQCPDTPGIITAPAPPKLIKKGLFTVDFIVKLLVLKYLLSMPMNRIRGYLRLEGLTLANGALAGVMQGVIPFLEPLYSAIRSRNAASCGRDFTDAELELIESLIGEHPTREAIARAVCNQLNWVKPDGLPKTMSAKVALLRMHRDGLIVLPAPRHEGHNIRRPLAATSSAKAGQRNLPLPAHQKLPYNSN